MASPRLLYVHTFGCQMNEYDSQRVQRLLAQKGYLATEDMSRADVIFLNTCSVREKAEQKVFSFLGRLRKLKAANPGLKVIVAGCMAQQLGRDLLKRFEHLDLVMGTRAIPSIGRLLDEIVEFGKRMVHLPEEEADPGLVDPDLFPASEISAPVTIMQGCNNFCTYCIVPYVRGRERSRPSDVILDEINALASKGAKEILLLGQNVNSYGRGLDEKIDFVGLLHRIQNETSILRVRFTTSHPKDLTDGLIQCFDDLPVLCKHLHLPVQAGSDRILKRMNRGYTAADYLEKIERLRRVCPDISLSSDIMVGFPGETEEDFQQTMNLLRTVRFDSLFSFRYSDRPFAKAVAFPDKVDEATKTRWLIELQELQASITLEANQAEVGKIREVLVEGPSKGSPDLLSGRTSQNRIVNFSGPQTLTGTVTPLRIVSAFSLWLKGEPIEDGDLS
ncbi:MAG: tRNA (N6-isopentenyl adenosine(37)-C2)-methylthiotransferase MiaB [Acidobacteriota bacterium]